MKVAGLLSLTLACACLSLLSCSIKEDRSDCLCRLTLDLSQNSIKKDQPVWVKLMVGEEECLNRRLNSVGGYVEALVPKGPAKILAVAGAPIDSLQINYGEECPHLYLYTATVEVSSEECSDTVRLHKSYCNIRLNLTGEGAKALELSFALSGKVNGYNEDGSVSMGPFLVSDHFSLKGNGSVSVPRQTDDSLILQMTDGNSCLRTFPLGEYLMSSAYDWTAEDLEDVDVTIDYANSALTLESGLWIDSRQFNIEL